MNRTRKAASKKQLAKTVRAREISGDLTVSERTLRRLFREHFAISPGQYQLSIRLQRVRDQLQEPATAGENISEIAARQGFWHMGRFSGQYRRHFGETPSQTRQGML